MVLFLQKEIGMESFITSLVARFEKGSLSRRELVQTLTILAASGSGVTAAAAAQSAPDFKAAGIDHVSIHVADVPRSTEFYQKMFGFRVVSQDRPRNIVRLGNGSVLVSLNDGKPAGTIDHFAIAIPDFNADTVRNYFMQHGATPLQGDYAGLHIKDPDGINVQVSQRGGG
jgi:catechol 2,3-dioxygenase-like lactoylglutathione lyase family enzyme